MMWTVLDRRKSFHLRMGLLPILLVSLLHISAAAGAGQDMKTSYACQGDRLDLQCPQGTVIKVMRANYGRFSVGICNEHGITDWSVNCMAPRSLRILQDRCDEREECQINASLDIRLEDDPCPKTEKYLEAHYVCHSLTAGPPTQESSTSTTTTPNPLPPWLTTRSPLSFLPGLYDIDLITPPPQRRIPVTAPESTTTTTTTTTTSSSTTSTTTTTTSTSTTRVTTTTGEARRLSESQAGGQREETDRLLYTSDRNTEQGGIVSIVRISTLPSVEPTPPAPHTGTTHTSVTPQCPPRHIRALNWGWTQPGSEVRQSCPPGTQGEARWTCRAGSGDDEAPTWDPPSPDLSQCQSVWMEKIITELKTSDLIINLANDLMQYVSVNALYGKDITSAIDAMTIIAEKMQYQLREIPTREQREAMVMELVQSLTKIASFLLSDQNLPAWQDLPVSQQTRFLTNFISALERTGSLLPGVVEPDQEVSMSSDNLLLTIRKISFRNIRGTQFPSRASLATNTWKHYSDTIDIPAQVLMENMDREAAQVVFLSMRNMEKLLVPGSERSEQQRQIVNSQVIHIAFGERSDLLRLTQPVSMMFRHRSEDSLNSPTCVLWDRERSAWSARHCQTVFSNSTHSQCHCSRVGSFALLENVVETDSLARTTFVVIVIVAVSVSTIVLISLVLVVIYCYRIKVRKQLKIKLNKADLSCFKNKNKCWSLTESPTLNEDLFPADNSDSAYDIVRHSDFMVLSRAALAAHDGDGRPVEFCRTLDVGDGRPTEFCRTMDVSESRPAEYCRTLDCSIPGPQVRSRPRQLELGSSHHIYMEVDPLYSIMAEPGVVSSTSSQTSSGYSTAPSNTNNLYELGQDYPDARLGPGVMMFQQLPSQSCQSHQTKDNTRVFPHGHGLRTSQRKRETNPELIMNNILLQQANRHVRL